MYLISFLYLQVWHVFPPNPVPEQSQENVFTKLLQRPPFWHGPLLQKSVCWQVAPMNPVPVQSQEKVFTKFEQTPPLHGLLAHSLISKQRNHVISYSIKKNDVYSSFFLLSQTTLASRNFPQRLFFSNISAHEFFNFNWYVNKK